MGNLEEVAKAILKARFYDCEPEMYGHDLDKFFREIDPEHLDGARYESRAAISAAADLLDELVEDRRAAKKNRGNDYISSSAGWLRHSAENGARP